MRGQANGARTRYSECSSVVAVFIDIRKTVSLHDKGKPVARRGRKATEPSRNQQGPAGLPNGDDGFTKPVGLEA